MSKKSAQKTPRRPSKRQLSHWEQQQKRQRIILISGISIIAAVIAVLVAGWLFTQYLPMQETVIKVNDVSYKMRYFIDALKLYGKGQSPANLTSIASFVIRDIEQNTFVRQEAAKLGFTVSESELAEAMKKSGLPNNEATRDLIRTQLTGDKLRKDYFDKQVPQTMAQRQIMAMLLESEGQAGQVRARLEAGEDFSKLAEELSLDAVSKAKKGDLGWHPESIYNIMLNSKVPVEYGFGSEPGTLSQPRSDTDVMKKVGYWLIKVTERAADSSQAKVMAVLVGSETEANSVKARLEAGEDFATVAKDLSQLFDAKQNGGDLGTVAPKDKSPAFDKYVFGPDIKIGQVSPPVRDDTVETKGGYWLIKVAGAEATRELSQEDRDTLINRALQEWVEALWLKPENVADDKPLTDEKTGMTKMAWAITQALKP